MTTSTFQYVSSTGACSMTGEVSHDSKVYIASNFEELREDFARGSGEYAFALAAIYGCDDEARRDLPVQMKKRFLDISDRDIDRTHSILIEEMHKSPKMSIGCKLGTNT